MDGQCPKCHSDNPAETVYCGKCGTKLDSAGQVGYTKTLEIPTEEMTRGTLFAGRYEIIEELGTGGMGKVYRGFDTRIKEEVAIKVLKPEIATDKRTIERFSNELKFARQVTHKNVCRMHDLHEEGKRPFVTMEYVRGEDLKSLIRRTRQIAVVTAVCIAKEISEGLAEAHKLGLIHRDLKPQNIMIDKEGNAKIMDFGIARSARTEGITAEGMIIGTPEYMSPEQAEGKEADQRSDLYSLGVILYEMVTGRLPFKSDTPLGVVVKHKTEVPMNPKEISPEIPDDLSRLILRCLEKSQDRRYQSAQELADNLGRLEISTAIRPKVAKRTIERLWEKKLPLGIAAIVLVGVAFVLDVGGIKSWLLGPASAPQVQTLAVLPFENLSGDPNQEYFVDGISDTITTELGKISSISVKSHTSSMKYKKTSKSIPQIAKELNAEAVIEGSVQRFGEKVKITAKLIHAAEDRQLWAKTYERDLSNILTLQDEISRSIAREIGIRLTEEAKVQLAGKKTVNPLAFEAYLKGIDETSHPKAVGYFQQAIELDPNYAPAYVGLADRYYYLGFFGTLPTKVAFLKMKEAALKALEKDDSLAEAHGYLALVQLQYDYNWKEAEKEFKLALKLNPSLYKIHHFYAHYLMVMGRGEESLAESKFSSELDPFGFVTACTGWHCMTTHSYDESIEYAKKGLPNPWARVILGWAYEQKSMFEEAIAEFQNAVVNWKGVSMPIAALSHAYAVTGKKKEAEDLLNQLIEQSKERFVSAYDIAAIHVGLGDANQAFEWLDRAYEERSGFLPYIKCDRRFDPLHSDPRYQKLLERIGIPPAENE